MSHEQTKAAHYIQLLDSARCNGDWEAVPELVRKVRKHAPQRHCLTLTAQSEYAVIQTSNGQPLTGNTPGSAAIMSVVVPLADAIEKERAYVEDEFQAQVCLAWIHWVLGDEESALSHLPESVEAEFSQLDGTGKESAGWTKICAIKAVYIKGTVLFKRGSESEALETFESAMPIVSPVIPSSAESLELRTWMELFLTQYCVVLSHVRRFRHATLFEADMLSAFRAWGRFWDRQPGTAAVSMDGCAPYAEVSRRYVWKQYYSALSTVLEQDLPYPTTSMATAYTNRSTRLQQRTELQGVESVYEGLLLKEVQFPRAEQSNEEVEEWAGLVMQNWMILCGSDWQEEELGPGGREATSRSVLEILYRAASKTFHSTSILRYLFTVHLSIAEFDLAFKAFDTYLELVKKGKARVEKTGEAEQGLDDDETVLNTASDCLRALCRYGSFVASEKARDLSHYFQDWLVSHTKNVKIETGSKSDLPPQGHQTNGMSGNRFSPKSAARMWGSIGIAQAQWARMTFDAGSRAELQLQAIQNLQKSLSPEYESSNDIETLFVLSLVLAERREINTALQIVKTALLPSSARSSLRGSHEGQFSRERSLIPLWHLLALLLSVRQDFTTAARSCEGAFEQFQDPINLFGENDINGKYRSEHLNGLESEKVDERPSAQRRGLVDEMNDYEKEAVLDVKMTQLVLLEVMEGPDVAVNACDELLSLYARLFGGSDNPTVIVPMTAQIVPPPQSSAGTLRSIKGSIFGRSRKSERQTATPSFREKTTLASRPMTSHTVAGTINGGAPTIQVTTENGETPIKPPHHDGKLQKRSGSLSRKKSQPSLRKRSRSTSRVRALSGAKETGKLQNTVSNPPKGDETSSQLLGAPVGRPGIVVSPDHSSIGFSAAYELLQDTTTQDGENQSSAEPGDSPTVETDHTGSSYRWSIPVTRFPKDQARRRQTNLLVRVWLLIAGFYRRAEMFEDAKGAIDEASKLVEKLELEVSNDTSGNYSVDAVAWGQRKSVEELFGDVFSERGYLSIAKAEPYDALSHFEVALVHYADHPSAIVGLSTLLLDRFTGILPPLNTFPQLSRTGSVAAPASSTLPGLASKQEKLAGGIARNTAASQLGPLGLIIAAQGSMPKSQSQVLSDLKQSKEASSSLLDRLAARDRAYGLLSGLTRRGTGWAYSEAWFALARAYEEGGQLDKAKEVLWWCVELEEGKAVREWTCVSAGGYVI